MRVRAGRPGTRAARSCPTRSYLSQSELPVTIGLGANDRVEAVEVRWPGGPFQPVPTPAGKVLTVIEQP